jgi:Trk K+ transport system NAD-binding subunit
MKSITAVVTAFLEHRSSRRNLTALFRLLLLLFSLIAIYSILFHVLMEAEGQHHSWITGVYWTLTVMTTLGFGDITFAGDAGRLFSVVVMMTGVMFLLVILPFTFIEFFYMPWMRAQEAARTPRELPADTRRHVIFTCHDPITMALIPMLEKYGHPYVILKPHVAEALELYEQGIKVAVGELDDPLTYERLRINRAAMLVSTRSDVVNTNITFTARELNENIPIVVAASSDEARDVLELAGATLVLRLEEMMGQALARRVVGKNSAAHVIGRSQDLWIAEANVAGTELQGRSLANSKVRSRTGLSVIGVWDHGRLATVEPHTMILRHMVLMLAGSEEQIASYNRIFSRETADRGHVVIVGGGRVGRITSKALQQAGIEPVIIEKSAERVVNHPEAVIGDAIRMETLKAAKARDAASILITTHDDDVNISLTIFFRRMRPNVQIISRCTLERNVGTLHRAGADLVLSSASMGANTIFNLLRKSDHLLLAEGVSLFPAPVPHSMQGRRLADCAVRSETGCTIIAVETDGERVINPDPDLILPYGGRMLLIGTLEAEENFLKQFRPELDAKALRRRWKKRED